MREKKPCRQVHTITYDRGVDGDVDHSQSHDLAHGSLDENAKASAECSC